MPLCLRLIAVLVAMSTFLGCQHTSGSHSASPIPAEDHAVPLIPRSILFGNPDRTTVRLSPDGRWITWLAPDEGVMNLWAAPADAMGEARAVTQDRGRGIRSYFWSYMADHILYTQDKDGDENWRVYIVNVATAEQRDLTPLDGVQARISGVSRDFPGEIIIGLNDRDEKWHDLWRLDLATGERTLLQTNPGFRGFTVDDDYRVRFASRYQPDGSLVYLTPNDEGGWDEFMQVPEEDTLNTDLAGFDKTGRILYMFDSRGRDTTALRSINLDTGEESLIAEDARADLSDITSHPITKKIEAVSFTYDRVRWIFFDDAMRSAVEHLSTLDDGDLVITTRTDDDKTWVVAFLGDAGPVRYYRYHPAERRAEFLFTNRPELEGLPLVPMRPAVITARDGLQLVSYLSLPHGQAMPPATPLPMVLMVHGGPWARDEWGYDSQHQWLANRGYAVLSVNFRGSTGFGKSFLNAGIRQWGANMQNDLTDAVAWAVAEGIADPTRVGIMGGSYGGYATLAGLTFTPDIYACGVSTVGPSSLITLLESIPPYWVSGKQMFITRVGDFESEEGRAFLESRSPLNFVENIRVPLLIGQGANDPRVKQAESDQIVAAMKQRGIPVAYVLYPDEGHGFARPENNISFNAVTEAFLARSLGGRHEPAGADFEGSSIQILAGAELLE